MSHGRGDEVLADLSRSRGGALTRYAFLLTGDVGAAQDLVQDAFVKVFARMRTGFAPDAAEAYVRQAILTLYIDGYRRRRGWETVRHLVASREAAADPAPASADTIDLIAALRRLSPQERASVVLRFYADLTVPDIAAQMQLSPGTVKRYLSNAIHKLEGILGPMQDRQDDGAATVPVTTVDRRAERS